MEYMRKNKSHIAVHMRSHWITLTHSDSHWSTLNMHWITLTYSASPWSTLNMYEIWVPCDHIEYAHTRLSHCIEYTLARLCHCIEYTHDCVIALNTYTIGSLHWIHTIGSFALNTFEPDWVIALNTPMIVRSTHWTSPRSIELDWARLNRCRSWLSCLSTGFD